MAYRNGAVLAAVERQLAERPWRGLAEVATALGVSRATVERALRTAGTTFRCARERAAAEALARLRAQPRSAKEQANALGFRSASAFSHWLRRSCNQASRFDA